MLLRYGELAISKLKNVGINITDKEIFVIKQSLDALSIDKEICLKNRYWDPCILDKLYIDRNKFSLPTGASSSNIHRRLKDAMSIFKTDYTIYYEKYWKSTIIPEWAIYSSVESWVKEKSINTIFKGDFYNKSNNIEKGLQLLQTNISYGLPTILKPIYDIQEPNSSFLRFVEMGAYNPITRRLIELNIPRETAIYLFNHYFKSTDQTNFSDIDLVRTLKSKMNNINMWMAIQIKNIV